MEKRINRSLKMDVHVMYNRMQCRGCGRFPSPYYRFICENGHLLCAYCVFTEFEINGNICWLSLEDKSKRVAGGPKKGAEDKSVAICNKEVKRCPADPVYCAVFNNSMWNCPGTVDPEEDVNPYAGGCEAVIKGENLFLHLQTEHGQSNQQNKKRKHEWFQTILAFEMHKDKKSTTNGME